MKQMPIITFTRRNMRSTLLNMAFLGIGTAAGLSAGQPAWSADEGGPHYKPASRAPAPMDIRTNAYGASRAAPEALGIGDAAPDFLIPRVGGGQLSLAQTRAQGDVVLVFYRGHW